MTDRHHPRPWHDGTESGLEGLVLRLAIAEPPPPFRPVRIALIMLLGATAAGAVHLTWAGPRPDLGASLLDPVTLAKPALPLILLSFALTATLRLSRPEGQIRPWPLALVGLAALGLVLGSLAGLSAPEILPAVLGSTLRRCLVSIVGLALLPLAVGLGLLRRGAPTRPALTGGLAGMAAGAAAAAGYALSCTEDSPLFFITWYGGAILVVAALGALAGSRMLRW